MRYITFFLPAFLIYSLFACKKPIERAMIPVWMEKDHPVMSEVSLFDTLRVRSLLSINLKEIAGVTAAYVNGKKTSYFEYDAEARQLLTLVSCLPFRKNNDVSDTLVRWHDFPFSQSGKDVLAQEEVDATGFFWNINPQDFDYYECLKSPSRHTILIHKKTGRILHRIETEA